MQTLMHVVPTTSEPCHHHGSLNWIQSHRFVRITITKSSLTSHITGLAIDNTHPIPHNGNQCHQDAYACKPPSMQHHSSKHMIAIFTMNNIHLHNKQKQSYYNNTHHCIYSIMQTTNHFTSSVMQNK